MAQSTSVGEGQNTGAHSPPSLDVNCHHHQQEKNKTYLYNEQIYLQLPKSSCFIMWRSTIHSLLIEFLAVAMTH